MSRFFRLHVIDSADRGDHGSRSAASALLERSKFFDRDFSVFDLKPHIAGQLAETHIGNRRKHRRGFRSDVFAILNAEEIACSALFDVFMLRRIEVHDIRITHFMTLFTRQKAGRIISADLHIACSTWSSTILFTVDGNQDRLDSLLEISTHRRTVNNQQGVFCRFDPQAGVVPNITGRR